MSPGRASGAYGDAGSRFVPGAEWARQRRRPGYPWPAAISAGLDDETFMVLEGRISKFDRVVPTAVSARAERAEGPPRSAAARPREG